MRLPEMKEPTGKIKSIDLKIIYDQMQAKEMWGKKVKTVVVADLESLPGSETALLDLYGDDVDKYKQKDKIRVVNGYYKTVQTKRGDQKLITPGFYKNVQVGRVEKIEE